MEDSKLRSLLPPIQSTWLGWAVWLLSVLCTSILISTIYVFGISETRSGSKLGFQTTTTLNIGHKRDHIVKRGSCATGGGSENYNVPFHVGGLFIILFVSTTACAFPILVIKFPRLRIPSSFLFSAKHFGTGVLIATAFVHLLPTAFISLGNPCLSGFWTTDYPAMPGAIALAGIFFVTVVEMIFSPAQRACGGGDQVVSSISRPQYEHEPEPEQSGGAATMRPSAPDGSQMRNLGPLQGRKTSISRTLSRMGEQSQRLDEGVVGAQRAQGIEAKDNDQLAIMNSERNQRVGGKLTSEQAHKKAILQCLLLEMGILFHSIFIGMSLSVSVGSEFVVLLIAIIFHRMFSIPNIPHVKSSPS